MNRSSQMTQSNVMVLSSASSTARLLLFCVIAALLAGCGSIGKRAPESSARPGGYYQDDGPGANPPANLETIAEVEPRVEPLHRSANNPYSVFGQDYVPLRKLRAWRERGLGSWYGRKFHGQRTSSGEPYDMYAMTAAHPVLPIPSYARVTNLATGKSVVVRINDRGPFRSGRIIDLSYTAAWKLGYAAKGSALVEVEAITPEEMPLLAARRATQNSAATMAAPIAVAAEPEKKPLEPAPNATVAAIPVSADPSGVYLQLGAFSARDNAENFRARIRDQLAWLDRSIEVLQKDGWFRLHLGPYRSRAEATGVAERIREALDLRAVFVVR
jgi:rare lipoprotein A